MIFFVILIHTLVKKYNNYWSNEVLDSVVVENQETDEQHSIVDSYAAVVNIIILVLFISFVRFSLQYNLLSPRISLLLKDSEVSLECMIAIPIYYFKNPLLRHYIWKKIILKKSTVQPENNQIELQSISSVQIN